MSTGRRLESRTRNSVCMATKHNPLLCELHAHTTWSDGALGVRDVCDLYGRHGFPNDVS